MEIVPGNAKAVFHTLRSSDPCSDPQQSKLTSLPPVNAAGQMHPQPRGPKGDRYELA